MASFLEQLITQPAATIAAAAVAAITSIIVSLVSPWVGLGANRRLESVKAELSSQIEGTKAELGDFNAARKARRDYEYEARKRLYTEIEPLLFQLYEAAEQSYFRVRSLARTSRIGDLSHDDSNWLSYNSYYLHTTLYYIILPATLYRIIKNKITFVDVYLDTAIAAKFYLAKIYYYSLTDDFIAANHEPKLPYDPNNKKWRSLIQSDPAIYFRQAFVMGDLEGITDLLTFDNGKIVRPRTFSEFEKLFKAEDSDRELVEEASQLFTRFSPVYRPVLARLLLVQACLAHLIIASFDMEPNISELASEVTRFVASDEFGKGFAWSSEIELSDRSFVEDYVVTRLGWLPTRTSSSY